ncbi:MAG TPA: hypothetical protein VIM41_05580 [Gammaproteobacteria bacterium]
MKYWIVFVILLALVIAGKTYLFLHEEYYYGPADVRIVTDDEKQLTDIYLEYGAAYYVIESSRSVYTYSRFVRSDDEVTFDKVQAEKPASYFYVSVCHPMYKCNYKQIQSESIVKGGKIQFGTIKLTNWQKIVADESIANPNLRFDFSLHLTDIETKYAAALDQPQKNIAKDEYLVKLQNLCKKINKASEDDSRCQQSVFERVFFGEK